MFYETKQYASLVFVNNGHGLRMFGHCLSLAKLFAEPLDNWVDLHALYRVTLFVQVCTIVLRTNLFLLHVHSYLSLICRSKIGFCW